MILTTVTGYLQTVSSSTLNVCERVGRRGGGKEREGGKERGREREREGWGEGEGEGERKREPVQPVLSLWRLSFLL